MPFNPRTGLTQSLGIDKIRESMLGSAIPRETIDPSPDDIWRAQPMPQTPPVTTQAPATGGTSYTVKAGDTLSEIARSLGVPQSSITGYRSGDPNLIFPGERLTVGTGAEIPGTTPRTQDIADQVAEAQRRLAELRERIDSPSPATPESVIGETPSIVDDIRRETEEAQRQREAVREQLENARIDIYNKEYDQSGLPETKERLSGLDDQISNLRAERDEAIARARETGGRISTAGIIGRVKRIADAQNAQINNVIQERNSIAEDYNRTLDEIGQRVEHQISDLATQYDHWGEVISRNQTQLQNYESLLRQELQQQQQAEQWRKEFESGLDQWAQQFGLQEREFDRSGTEFERRLALDRERLEEAPAGRDPRWEAVTDRWGDVLYWYNTYNPSERITNEDYEG